MASTLDPTLYRQVINSPRWRRLRERLIQQRGARCEHCGKTWAPGYRTSLQLHHKTYERLGHELESDLQLVCAACHEGRDQQRAADAKVRAARALEAARLDGWASKKYGEDWRFYCDPDTVAAEFDAWLDELEDGDWIDGE